MDENKNTALTGFFQTRVNAAEGDDKLLVRGLNKGMYKVRVRPQRLYIGRFGELLKHISPVEIKPDGFIMSLANRHYTLADYDESIECSSCALESEYHLQASLWGQVTTRIFVFSAIMVPIYTSLKELMIKEARYE